mgnify:CR=1 FL=1
MAKAKTDSPPKKTHLILPLRMVATDVPILDAAVKRAGYKSRTKFLHDAIAAYVRGRGDKNVSRFSFSKNGPAETAAAPAEAAATT